MAAPMKVLLPVDGSVFALAAVAHALQALGQREATEFVLLNVQEPASLYEVVVAHDAERIVALKREAGADLLSAAEGLLDAAGARYQSEVAAGVPEHLIVERAEDYGCHAIVMGARGQDAEPDSPGLGPVALAVLEASPMPVTVVRPAAAAEPSAAA